VKDGKLDLMVPPTVWDWAIHLIYMGPGATAKGGETVKVKPDFHWPNGAKGAVSLTYDDAIPTQINVVGPTLDQYGLKGTFFIEGDSESVKKERDRWLALSREGHEFASHSMVHPCDETQDWVRPQNRLEVYTLDRMSKELDDSIVFLQKLTSKKPTTFAYPCGESYVGKGKDEKSYVPLVAQKFLAGRTTENQLAVPGTFPLAEVPCVDAWSAGDQLVEWVKRAVEKGAWVVFMFHGVGGDYITVSPENHRQLAEYLAKNKAEIWTAPFGEVAGYLKSEEAQD